MNVIFIIFILVFIFALVILFIFRYKKKKLTKKQKLEIIKIFNKIKKINNFKEKIIDYDKLYHKILQQLGYKGSFGEILKTNPKEIFDINKIWELHKLRNILVHSFEKQDKKKLEIKQKDYEKEIIKILKNI